MMEMPEQLCRCDKSRRKNSGRFWLKKYHARLLRRLAKKQLQDAPHRIYCGWTY